MRASIFDSNLIYALYTYVVYVVAQRACSIHSTWRLIVREEEDHSTVCHQYFYIIVKLFEYLNDDDD